ncbi:iron uptake porin [Geminocystis sp. GBBB08]|uniref:iron uptake porin n=1 Tax=Geminocystis sp. GBBB08 TaxID=2604140 RepID=UPI0027E3165C|nr:iron uptake porin [Geminocystis sp. GBBB08]
MEISTDTASFDVENNSFEQVTSVSQLRDVSPTDWAFEALRNLVERYGCIVGYPDRTFRGNRALNRYEFAAGLNACMQQMERLIASSESVLRSDIEKLKRLITEFETELAALGARVDNLEGRVAFLEDNQFSTTTKLTGEVIMSLATAFNDDTSSFDGLTKGAKPVNENQTVLSYRSRFNFDTSFMGKDRLRVRIQAGNIIPFNGNTDMTRLSYDTNTSNDMVLDDLFYRFPIGNKITAFVGTNAMNIDKVFDVDNPYLESDSTGTLTRFFRRNPLVFRGPEGTGGGIKVKLNDQWNFNTLYVARNASSPEDGKGFFNGAFSTGAQIGFSPSKPLKLSLAYLYTYQPQTEVNLTDSTGSPIGANPFAGSAANAHRVGLQGTWRIANKVNISGWGGYASADNLQQQATGRGSRDNTELWTWAGNVSFLDIGKEGAILSFAGGMPPKDSDDRNTSYLLELQYKYPVSDNIIITPGTYVVFNPNHDSRNDTVWVGVVRTTFKF